MIRDPRRVGRLLRALSLTSVLAVAAPSPAAAQPLSPPIDTTPSVPGPAGPPVPALPTPEPPPSAPEPPPAVPEPVPTTPEPAPATPVPGTGAPGSTPAQASAAAPATPAKAVTPAAAHAQDRLAIELEAELVKQAIGDVQGDDYELEIYGFLDFTYTHLFRDFAFAAPFDSFAIGNFNLYLASELGDNWRTLAEVRYSYLPHGAVQMDETGSSRLDTTAGDYTDFGRPLRWGSTIIERAWLEYTVHPLLTARVGHWLTPYGIWNVDHGSPVVIGVRRPFIVGESLLPQSQTGIELRGTHNFERLQLGYHLTLSNGRGPIDTHQDLDDNKAFGARLFARADTAHGAVTVGVSGYMGRYTDRNQEFVVEDGTFETRYPRTAQYDELALAADLKWEYRGFLLQSEAILNDRSYDDALRPQVLGALDPSELAPDDRRVGIYGLAGYRFEWLGTMPFAGVEYYDAGAESAFIQKSAAFWGGLNAHPTARVVLKAQYTYSWFPDGGENLPDGASYNALDLQAAWSF